MKRLLALVLLLVPAVAHAAGSLYDDARYQAWVKDYLAGKRAAVLRSVEKDILSAAPHPLATRVWYDIVASGHRFDEEWKAVGDAKLRAALTPVVDACRALENNTGATALATYPADSAKDVHDLNALVCLAGDAENDYRTHEELLYGEAIVSLRGDSFWAAWLLDDALASSTPEDHERLAKHFAAGGDWAGTPIGAYLARLDRFEPRDDLETRDAGDAWLGAVPHDEYAYARRAIVDDD
jgi:hypothetical protein